MLTEPVRCQVLTTALVTGIAISPRESLGLRFGALLPGRQPPHLCFTYLCLGWGGGGAGVKFGKENLG